MRRLEDDVEALPLPPTLDREREEAGKIGLDIGVDSPIVAAPGLTSQGSRKNVDADDLGFW